MNVEDKASQSSAIFGMHNDWRDQILGFMFPQVVQRH